MRITHINRHVPRVRFLFNPRKASSPSASTSTLSKHRTPAPQRARPDPTLPRGVRTLNRSCRVVIGDAAQPGKEREP